MFQIKAWTIPFYKLRVEKKKHKQNLKLLLILFIKSKRQKYVHNVYKHNIFINGYKIQFLERKLLDNDIILGTAL